MSFDSTPPPSRTHSFRRLLGVVGAFFLIVHSPHSFGHGQEARRAGQPCNDGFHPASTALKLPSKLTREKALLFRANFLDQWSSASPRQKIDFARSLRHVLNDTPISAETSKILSEIAADAQWLTRVGSAYSYLPGVLSEFARVRNSETLKAVFAQTDADLIGVRLESDPDYLGIFRRYQDARARGQAWNRRAVDPDTYHDDLMRAFLTGSLDERVGATDGRSFRDYLLDCETRDEPYIHLLLAAASERAGHSIRSVRDLTFYPSPRDIANTYEKLVKASGVAEEDLIRPARPALLPDATLRFFTFSEPLPAGAQLIGHLDNGQFFKALSEGYMPLGSPYEITFVTGIHSAFEHDVGHLAGFLASPRYMRAIRRTIRDLYQRYASQSLNWDDFSFYYVNDRSQSRALEEFAIFRESFYHEAPRYLPALPPELAESQVRTHLFQRLQSLPRAEALKEFATVSPRYRRWLLPLGGAQADLFSTESRTPYHDDSMLSSPWHQVNESYLATLEGGSAFEISYQNFLTHYAELQTLIWRHLRQPTDIDQEIARYLNPR